MDSVVGEAGTTEVDVTTVVLAVVSVVTELIISVLIITAVWVRVVLWVVTLELEGLLPPEPKYALPTEPTKITQSAMTRANNSLRF
jgi:hypothetical protein